MTPKELPGHVYESVCLNQITTSRDTAHSLCLCAVIDGCVFLCTQLYAGAILEVCGWKLGRFPQVQGEFSIVIILWYLLSSSIDWYIVFQILIISSQGDG